MRKTFTCLLLLFALTFSLPTITQAYAFESSYSDTRLGDKELIKVYPNPTASQITIEVPGEAWLYITAMDGRIVCQREINQTQVIDMSAWSSGVYSLTLQTDNEMQTQKVIKN